MNPPLYSVLIVDDSDRDLVAMARLLEQAGFVPPFATVESAALAQELLETKGSLFQIAFFDLRMPSVDGLQLLEWVRARPELGHIKIIMVTGDNDPEMIGRARELGADGFFSKYPRAPKLAAILADIAPGLIQPVG